MSCVLHGVVDLPVFHEKMQECTMYHDQDLFARISPGGGDCVKRCSDRSLKKGLYYYFNLVVKFEMFTQSGTLMSTQTSES